MFFERLVLATGNRNKDAEFLELLPHRTVGQLVFAPEIAPMDVDETGTTYAMNALLKSQAWAKVSGLPSLADDSGIEVEALSWGPGVHSARIVPGSDADRRQWLLSRMKGESCRRAHFVAAVALTVPGKWTLICEGVSSGRLAECERGDGGFGYDPLFIPDDRDRSFGELSSEVKNEISHRARAVKTLLEILAQAG